VDLRQLEHERALREPRRHAIYTYVRGSRWPVTREDVADATGISRSLAAFHLERLLDAGLVEVVENRRALPRGGRPPKQYRATPDVEVSVSVPPRRYQLAGEILVRAIADADVRRRVESAALGLAADAGEKLGRPRGANGKRRKTTSADDVAEALTEAGYEPVVDGDEIVLANCPFHALAGAERDLTCQMNHAFVDGVIRGIGDSEFAAELSPCEGRCCVVLKRRS
jgi:predicted ArsR family transcriptional regulator